MTSPHETGPPTLIEELPPLQEDRLYAAEEAAPYIGVKPNWLKRAAGADRVQHTSVGRFKRWSAQNIRDIVAGVPHQPSRQSRRTHKNAAATIPAQRPAA